jgi:hypothetical protein
MDPAQTRTSGTKKEINHESIPPRREKHEKGKDKFRAFLFSCFRDEKN